MKYLLLILISLNLFAEDECQEKGLDDKLNENLAPSNCLSFNNKKFLKIGKIEKVCTQCKSEFLEKSKVTIAEKNKDEDLKKILFDEYQKNMTYALTELMKIRKLPGISHDFKATISSCSFPKEEDFNQCSDLKKMKSKFDNLKSEMASEVFNMISTEKKQKGFFERKNTCDDISEEKMILAINNQVEIILSKNIQNLLDTKSETDFINILDTSYSKLHPSLSQFESPEDLKKFLRTIKDPKTLKEVRETLLSNNQSKASDEKIANLCKESLNGIKEALCSKKSTDLEGIKYLTHLDEKFNSLSESKAISVEDQKINAEALAYCPDGKVYEQKLSDLLSRMSKSMPTSFMTMPAKSFNNIYFDQSIGTQKEYFCKKSLETANLSCQTYKPSDAFLDKAFYQYKCSDELYQRLADSSSNDVNSAIRTLLGEAKVSDPKIKLALQKEGLLPQDDGTVVDTATDPVRSKDFSKRYVSNDVQSLPEKNNPQTSSNSQIAEARFNSEAHKLSQKSMRSTSDQTTQSETKFPELGEADAELERIQNEIKRRLALPQFKNATPEEKTEVAQNVARSFKKSLPPTMIPELIAPRTVASLQPEVSASAAAPLPSVPTSSQGNIGNSKAQASAAASEKRLNSALSQMHGAQASLEKVDDKNDELKTEEKAVAELNLDLTKDTKALRSLLLKKENFNVTYKQIDFGVVFKNDQYEIIPMNSSPMAIKVKQELSTFINEASSTGKLKELNKNLNSFNLDA